MRTSKPSKPTSSRDPLLLRSGSLVGLVRSNAFTSGLWTGRRLDGPASNDEPPADRSDHIRSDPWEDEGLSVLDLIPLNVRFTLPWTACETLVMKRRNADCKLPRSYACPVETPGGAHWNTTTTTTTTTTATTTTTCGMCNVA